MIKKLSTKGQIVLPAGYRKRMGLRPGHPIEITQEGDKLVLEPVRSSQARFVRLHGYPKPILKIGKDRTVRDAEVTDILDDDA